MGTYLRSIFLLYLSTSHPVHVNLDVSFVVAIVVISCYIVMRTLDPSRVYQAESGQDLSAYLVPGELCYPKRPQGTVDCLAGGPGDSSEPFWGLLAILITEGPKAVRVLKPLRMTWGCAYTASSTSC